MTYIYDGQEFIGIVNGVRRYVSRENPHLLGIIGGEIKSAPTQGESFEFLVCQLTKI